MKSRKKKLIVLGVIVVVALLIAVYIRFFNGSIVYFTTGMKDSQLIKADGDVTYTFEAELLMSDVRAEYEEMFGEDIWSEKVGDAEFEEYIKDQIKTKLMRVRAMTIMADERGIVLGRDEKQAVNNAAEDLYATLTDSQIKSTGITVDKLKEMYTDFAVAKKLYEDLTSTMEIEVSSDEARVINIQYIVSDSEEEINEAYSQVMSGSSFYAVAKECNDDEQYEYELKRGEMAEEFEEVAFNLTTGDVSEVFEAGGRYYIIRCTSDNDKTKTEVNKSAILEQRKLWQFNAEFEPYEADIYMEFNDSVWDEMSISDSIVFEGSFEKLFNSYFGE